MKNLNLQAQRLFSLPYSCVNRGENNEVKTTVFGGYLHTRISAQSMKRASRETTNETLRADERAIRTSDIIPTITRFWEESAEAFPLSTAEAAALRSNLTAIGTSGGAKGRAEKPAPLFLGFGEIRKITEYLQKNPEELKALCVAQSFKLSDQIKKLAEEKGEKVPKIDILTKDEKQHKGNIPSCYDTPDKLEEIYAILKNGKFTLEETEPELKTLATKSDASRLLDKASKGILAILTSNAHGPDVAINGRMNAGSTAASVESTCMFAHAISIGIHDVEEDFFSVMDESEAKIKEHNGSALIGRNEGASATYYGFANLDITALYKNLHGEQGYSKEAVIDLVLSFMESATLSLPKARQTTMFGRTLPHYVRITVKPDARVFSSAEVFVKPIYGSENGSDEEAIERLESHRDVEKAYGTDNYLLDETIRKGKGSLADIKAKIKTLLEAELD